MTRAPFAPRPLGGCEAEHTVAIASLMLLLSTGCALTPGYNPPRTVPPSASVATAASTNAALYDSLARDGQLPVPLPPGAAFDATSTQALAWLDVLHDTTLVRLVSTALQDNQDIRGAIARVNEYRALAGSARSQLFPEVDANGSVSTNQIVFGGSPPTAYKAIRATADLQWELDFWGRIRKGVAASEADLAARSDDERAMVLTLVADVADAYLELLEAREERGVSERALVSRQATSGLARQRFAQGVISELDVRQFEADVAGAAASVAEFTRTASQKEHALSLLLGHAPGPLVGGGTLDASVVATAVPDSVPAAMLLRRPDVMSAERALAAEQARTGATRAAVLPRFLITGEYGWQSPSASDVFGADHEVYTLQLGVSVPIFAGGRAGSELAAARARIDQARARYEQAVLRALSEAADALVGVRTAREQLAALTAQANALRDAYRLAERRYEGGIASYLEVLDAQRGLFGAELAVTQGRRFYLEATVHLYQALGGRWNGAT
jgi:outer membrane protein, multidrug efflux system